MRTFRIAVALAIVVALTGLLPTGPAAAAAPNVLTFGAAPGGAAVPLGDTPTAPAAGPATFTTGPGGGGVGTKCTLSAITGQVVANPVSPGTATVKVVNQTFSGCTSTIPGVALVTGVIVNNLPYMGNFSDAAGFPITITPIGPPLQVTINETLTTGAAIVCVWQFNAGVYHGNYLNAGNKIQLVNQQTHMVGGPAGPCGGPNQFLNVTYAPFIDSLMLPPNQVWVN